MGLAILRIGARNVVAVAALSASAVLAPTAKAAIYDYEFNNVTYTYTTGQTPNQPTFNCVFVGGNKQECDGTLSGTFSINTDLSLSGAYNLDITSPIYATSIPDYTSGDNQPIGELVGYTFDAGYLLPPSGNISMLYIYNTVSGYGMELSLLDSTFPLTGGAISFSNTVGNDNFCINVTPLTVGNGGPKGGCTSSKNNLTITGGSLTPPGGGEGEVPSPAIALGLLPLSILSLKRRQKRKLVSAS